MKYEMFTKRKVFIYFVGSWHAAYRLHPRILPDLRNLSNLGHTKLYPRFCPTLYNQRPTQVRKTSGQWPTTTREGRTARQLAIAEKENTRTAAELISARGRRERGTWICEQLYVQGKWEYLMALSPLVSWLSRTLYCHSHHGKQILMPLLRFFHFHKMFLLRGGRGKKYKMDMISPHCR